MGSIGPVEGRRSKGGETRGTCATELLANETAMAAFPLREGSSLFCVGKTQGRCPRTLGIFRIDAILPVTSGRREGHFPLQLIDVVSVDQFSHGL